MTRHTLIGCGAIALWSFTALLTRGAPSLPPLALMALCFAVSSAGGVALLAALRRLGELRQPPLAWVHGVGGLFGSYALYFAALALASPAEASLINYSWPSMVVLFSPLLLGVRLTKWHLIGLALTTFGCGLLLARGAHFTREDTIGYALAVASAVVWAAYCLAARRMAAVPTGAVAGFCALTAVLAAATHCLFEPPAHLDARSILCVLLIGLGPVGGALFLWDIGMKRGDPVLLGTLANATPVLSTLLLITAGFAPLTMYTVAAATLVAAGGLAVARQ
jgi:drug/metabolite transporter (DMT)-like permease